MKFVAEHLAKFAAGDVSKTGAMTPAFIIRAPSASPTEPPLAFGTLFTAHIREVPGYTLHSFGKSVQIFTLNKPQNTSPIQEAVLPSAAESFTSSVVALGEESLPPASPESLQSNSLPLTPSLSPQSEQVEPPATSNEAAPTPASTVVPTDMEALPPMPPPQPAPIATKKVKRQPPPPPPRDPRPRISQDHALLAKTALASIPEIQASAKASSALTPVIPFTQAETLSTLHILKNGEKPGNKALKALRAYIAEDSNFKDAIRSQSVRLVRANLERLAAELLG